MPVWTPGTRAFRELIRSLSSEDDGKTTDPVGLYPVNAAGQRRALQPFGGRMSSLVGTRAFRQVTTAPWFLASGTWNDNGVWRDDIAWT